MTRLWSVGTVGAEEQPDAALGGLVGSRRPSGELEGKRQARMTPGRPSVDDHEWLRRRYVADQASVRQIAAQAECSTSTVRRALAAADIPARSRGRRNRLRLLEAEQLVRLLAAHGQAGAALELGVDPKTLYREVRRLGIAEQARAAMRSYRRASSSGRAQRTVR